MTTTRITLRIEKNQLLVPDHLMRSGSELILTFDPLRCLALITPPIWAQIRDKIIRYESDSPQVMAIKRTVISNAREVRIDELNRLHIGSQCMEFANLKSTAYWIPHTDIVRIWDPEVFEKAGPVFFYSAAQVLQGGR